LNKHSSIEENRKRQVFEPELDVGQCGSAEQWSGERDEYEIIRKILGKRNMNSS
jgi:hypothetical protein